MQYQIKYAAACRTGKVREKNQDNLWVNHQYLSQMNDGMEEIWSGQKSISEVGDIPFAIFDGMGGEQCGETAAFLAAKTLEDFVSEGKGVFNGRLPKEEERDEERQKDVLLSLFRKMNQNVVTYSQQEHISHMGSTVAMVVAASEGIWICNLGDSKIFVYREKQLIQISKDHVAGYSRGKKPALTQHLGISEKFFLIEPYLAREAVKERDKYLICSDGLTDMLAVEEIQEILGKSITLEEAINQLMNQTFERGAIDNTTIIIFEIVQDTKSVRRDLPCILKQIVEGLSRWVLKKNDR